MSNKPGIPAVHTSDKALNRTLAVMKEILDTITGQAKNTRRFDPLPPNATLEQVIERVNAMTERMQ